MNDSVNLLNVDFTVNREDLYREETFMDLKIAQIRRLTPIHLDGSMDENRSSIFVGYTKVMSSKGPVSLHNKLDAQTLEEAIEKFPDAMNQAVREIAEKAQK